MKRSVISMVLMLTFLSGIAQNKSVQVTVKNDWQEVVNHYGETADRIESLLQDTIIFCLKNSYPFFEFTGNADNYQLEVKITDNNQGNGSPSRHAIEFEIRLKGSKIRSNSDMIPISINKSGKNFIFPRTKEEFVGRLAGDFFLGQKKNNDLIVNKLLCHIPITNDAFFLKGPETWVIPASFTNSKIARESHLLIELHPSDLAYGIQTVESVVSSAICNIEDAKQKHKVPLTYPPGCLIGIPLIKQKDFSDTIYTTKYVYIKEYKLFKIAGLVFNNSECDVYNQ